MAQRVERATRARLQATAAGLLVVLGSAVVSGALLGVPGGLGAAAAAVVVIAFLAAGHLSHRVFLAITDMRGLIANLLGYLVRVALVWVVGVQLTGLALGPHTRAGIAVGAVAGVVGWIGALSLGQVIRGVPIYDSGHRARQGWVA